MQGAERACKIFQTRVTPLLILKTTVELCSTLGFVQQNALMFVKAKSIIYFQNNVFLLKYLIACKL